MSENNVNGIIGADVATTTGIVGATIAIGQYIVNDYVITIAEAEGDYGYTMTITRGTDTQTVTLYGLTPEQYNAMLGYLEQAQTAAQSAQSAAESAGQSETAAREFERVAGISASSASSAKNAAQSAASNARSAASDAASAKNDAVTAKNAAEAAATRAETAAGQITGMTAEAETLEPGSSATASFLDGVLSLGIPAGAPGADGDDGNGIVSIVKTGTSGNVDTYTITYTNGTTSAFTVTNGVDGAVTSVAGKTGAVTLNAGDVAFDDQETYNDGTVGAGLTNIKSQLYDLQGDTFNNDAVVPIDPIANATSFDGFYINDAASANNKIRFSASAARYRVYYFPPAQKAGIVKAKVSSNSGVRIAVAKLVNPVITVAQTTFDVPYVDGYVYAVATTSFVEVAVREGDTVMLSYKYVDTLTVEGNFIKQNIVLSENVANQVKSESEGVVDTKLKDYTEDYYTYTNNIENGNISSTGTDVTASASKCLRTVGLVPIQRKTANIYVSRDLTAIPSLGNFTFYFFDANGEFIEYKAGINDSVFPSKNAVYMRYVIATTGDDRPDLSPSDARYINVWQLSVVGEMADNNHIKWCAMGDSITVGWYSYLADGAGASGIHSSYGWAQILAGLKNWYLNNIAIGGTGYVRGGYTGTGNSSGARLAYDTNFAQYDIVTLAYGTNDWKDNRMLGSPTDAPLTNAEIEAATGTDEPGNLCKNMKYVIEKIMADNPNCKIVVITPINCAAFGDVGTNWGIGYELSQSRTLEDVFNAEKTICEYYGIAYIDMTHSSIVNRLNMLTACYDGVHPSILSHKSMAREINARIGY